MREAGRINAEALAAARAIIRPGVTTADLNAAAEEVLKKHGCYSPFKGYPGPYPYPASTNVSVNDELVHGIPGKRKLKEGDIVSVDCGTVFEGYVGDSAFTACVGSVSPEAQKLVDTTEGALYAGIEKMVAGNHVGDISAAIQNYAESRGFSCYPRIHRSRCWKSHARGTASPELWHSRTGTCTPSRHDHRDGTDVTGRHTRNQGTARPVDGFFSGWFFDRSLRAYHRGH